MTYDEVGGVVHCRSVPETGGSKNMKAKISDVGEGFPDSGEFILDQVFGIIYRVATKGIIEKSQPSWCLADLEHYCEEHQMREEEVEYIRKMQVEMIE